MTPKDLDVLRVAAAVAHLVVVEGHAGHDCIRWSAESRDALRAIIARETEGRDG